MPYALCFLLFMLGLYCAVVKKNMVKIVIGIMVMEYAVNLFLIMLGYLPVAINPVTGEEIPSKAPIVSREHIVVDENGQTVVDEDGQIRMSEKFHEEFVPASVDPLPQALVLTSIVISLGSLALMISICIRVYEKYGTFDITQIRRLKG